MHKTEVEIPPGVRKRLTHLFGLIEKEFESVCQDNVVLQEKVESLTEKVNEKYMTATEQFQVNSKQKPPTGQKLKTAEKLKAQTSKIVSSFKSPSAANCQFVKEYGGHRDGLWDLALPRTGQPVIGTCSAGSWTNVTSLSFFFFFYIPNPFIRNPQIIRPEYGASKPVLRFCSTRATRDPSTP